MSYLETIDTKELMLLANDVLKDYNKCREEFFNLAKHYFRQSATSEYTKEDTLIIKLNRCKELKTRYKALCQILASRNVKPRIGGFTPDSSPKLELEDILHLV